MELFKQIQESLMQYFGDVGGSKIVLMDHEIAAHNACSLIFSQWEVRSCYFHFVNNVIAWIKNNNLTSARKKANFNRWLNELLGN
jgi:hypothetical protein